MLILVFILQCFQVVVYADTVLIENKIKQQTGIEAQQLFSLPQEDVNAETQLILKNPLQAQDAVRLALLHNPMIKVWLAQIGVDQAQMLTESRIKNPQVSVSARESNEPDTKTNTSFEVKQDLLDLLSWGGRKRVANQQLKIAHWKIVQQILDLVHDVHTSLYTWQAAKEMFDIKETYQKAQKAAMTLAQRQKEAGNINDLNLAQQQVAFDETSLKFAQARRHLVESEEHLRYLLGINAQADLLLKVENLSSFVQESWSLSELETLALAHRMDLLIAQQEVENLKQSKGLYRLTFIPSIQGGFEWEREVNGEKLKGPHLEMDVPVFDRQQATRLAFQSNIDLAKHHLVALEDKIRLDVREAFNQLNTQKELVQTYQKMLPSYKRIVDEALRHYNYMLKDVYDLLEAKQKYLEAQLQSIEALRDYWIARSRLEKAVGGQLFASPLSKNQSQESSDRENLQEVEKENLKSEENNDDTHQHHHHGGDS